MNHAAARGAIDALFSGEPKQRAELRAHLDGCLECRAYYDAAARAFRALGGSPDEMTQEELWLFEPVLPEAPRRLPLPAWLGGLALAAAAAVAVVLVWPTGDGGFTARGGGNPASRPALRGFCTRSGKPVGEVGSGACQPGDAVVFSVVPNGRAYVGLALRGEKPETIVSGERGRLSNQGEVVLPFGTRFAPGAAAVGVFGAAPVSQGALAGCLEAAGCPQGLERVELVFPGGAK